MSGNCTATATATASGQCIDSDGSGDGSDSGGGSDLRLIILVVALIGAGLIMLLLLYCLRRSSLQHEQRERENLRRAARGGWRNDRNDPHQMNGAGGELHAGPVIAVVPDPETAARSNEPLYRNSPIPVLPGMPFQPYVPRVVGRATGVGGGGGGMALPERPPAVELVEAPPLPIAPLPIEAAADAIAQIEPSPNSPAPAA